MSLEAIIQYILDNAKLESDKLIKQAQEKANQLRLEAREKGDKLYQLEIAKAKTICLNNKEREIVNASLASKQKILCRKQEFINLVFEKLKDKLKNQSFKKQQIDNDGVKEVSVDINYYLEQIRRDYETEVSRVLFFE